MAKTLDLKFDNQDEFLKKYPHFSVVKQVPAHTVVKPNYGAIREVLRAGQKLDGVALVDMPKANATDESKVGEILPPPLPSGDKRTLRDVIGPQKDKE